MRAEIFDETISSAAFWQGLAIMEKARLAPARDYRWRASEIGKCEIAQLLGAHGIVPDEPSGEELLKFRFGSVGEKIVLDAISAGLGEGQVLHEQVEVGLPDLNLGGHVDGVVYDTDSGAAIEVIEVKTFNSWYWKHLSEEGIENAYFYGQLQAYAQMLAQPVTLIVLERNTPMFHALPVPPNEDYWKDVAAAIKVLDAYYEEGIFPSLEALTGDVACSFCQYRNICQNGHADLSVLLKEHQEQDAAL